MTGNRRFTRLLCGLAILQGLGFGLRADEPQDDQILFLHLKIKDGVVTLVDSSVARGRLKTPMVHEKYGDLYLELASTNGVPLWSDVLADPAVRRYEYEDPDHPGQLKMKEVKLDQAEFTLRVPRTKAAKHLKVYRLEQPATKTAAMAPGKAKALLGAVELPAPENQP